MIEAKDTVIDIDKYLDEMGYTFILDHSHPRANSNGYVAEHILVWEFYTGKPLPEGWVVHHLNGIKNDNRPENLMAMPRKNHSTSLLMKEIQTRLKKVENELKALKTQGALV